MARPLRIEFPGAIHHIIVRGNAREHIFNNDADKRLLLIILDVVVGKCSWLCHAYCLMPNHFHLLIETPRGNISKGMQRLNGLYTQRYNRRYRRTGHVFEGRFKSVLVKRDPHLLELVRYVVLNPVRAGLAGRPEEWQWSSYRATSGYCAPPVFLTTDTTLNLFSSDRQTARRRFEQFVLEAASRKEQCALPVRPEAALKPGELKKAQEPRIDKILAPRKPLGEIIADDIEMGEFDRAVYLANVHYGYALREIGKHVGMHHSTLSRRIRMVTQSMHQTMHQGSDPITRI